MVGWLFGEAGTIGFVVVSTVLIYLSAVLGMRLLDKRSLSEMTAFDFAAAVAVGSIVARTATAERPSYLQGLVAVMALLLTHMLLGLARRRWTPVRHVFEKRPVLLIDRGELVPDGLHAARLTRRDIDEQLRLHGLGDIGEVGLMVLESSGRVSLLSTDERSRTEMDVAEVALGDGVG